MNLKEIFRSISVQPDGFIKCYYTGRKYGVSNNSQFAYLTSLSAVKALVKSNENIGATIITHLNDLMYVITEHKSKYNDKDLKYMVESFSKTKVENSWTTNTLAKALAFISTTIGYYVSIDGTIPFNNIVSGKTIAYNEGRTNLYQITVRVGRKLESEFQKKINEAKHTVTSLVGIGDFIEAEQALKKIVYSSSYRNVTPRNIEFSDVVKEDYSRKIQDNTYYSDCFETSSKQEIRAEAAKVLYATKTTINEYFG